MKKIVLFAAALLFAVACSQSKPGEEPTPPTPTGDPTINITEIKGKKAVTDTVHVVIGNYTGEVKIEISDNNYAVAADTETLPGTIIIKCYTAGSLDISFVCGSKTFKIPATFDKAITEKVYNETLLPFGKTVEEVKKLEADRGGVFLKQEVQKNTLFVKFTPANPVKVAVDGEELVYVFDQISEGQYGVCKQTSIYTYYGAGETAGIYADMAWVTTTENNFYGGEREGTEISLALTRDLATLISYQSGQYTDKTWGFQAHFQQYTPSASAPQAIVEAKSLMTKTTQHPAVKLVK